MSANKNPRDAVESVAEAMATTFRIHIAGWKQQQARQAAIAAFEELHHLERMLSRFIDGSDIDRINRAEPGTPVRVRADTFDCLQTSLAMERLTGGAFNITAGSINAPMENATTFPNMRKALLLDEPSLAVVRNFPETLVDLGGIGKGFAVDVMSQLLREWEVPAALVDAGGSTIFAYSSPDLARPWTAGLHVDGQESEVEIENFGFAASGTSVKGDHIVDGRTGKIAASRIRTWSMAPNAAEADALSTAFFVMEDSEIENLCAKNTEIGAAWDTLQNGRSVAHGCGRLANLMRNRSPNDQSARPSGEGSRFGKGR
jgi:thiamine biosynthesis lipoprotein